MEGLKRKEADAKTEKPDGACGVEPRPQEGRTVGENADRRQRPIARRQIRRTFDFVGDVLYARRLVNREHEAATFKRSQRRRAGWQIRIVSDGIFDQVAPAVCVGIRFRFAIRRVWEKVSGAPSVVGFPNSGVSQQRNFHSSQRRVGGRSVDNKGMTKLMVAGRWFPDTAE